MSHARILLSTPNVAYEQRIRQAFGGALNGELRWLRDANTADAVFTQAAESGADVLALGPDLPVDAALGIAKALDQHRPDISVILVAAPSPELYEGALRSGVRDVIAPDALDAELREVFQRALDVADRRRASLQATDATASRGKILAVLSPKGGSGKTTTATNLAVVLAEAAPGQVVLVDLDLQFGDAASALGLVPEHTMTDAARAVVGMDALTLKVFLTPHSSGLYVLCGPDSPEQGEDITADQVARVIDFLAQEFSHVVIDTSAGLGEHTLVVVESATDLLLICSMDVASVRGLRKELLALDQLGMNHQSRHFVLNRADSRVGLDVGDIEATIGLPVDLLLPSTRAVPTAGNLGNPVVASDPRAQFSRRLRELADRFVEPGQDPGRRDGGGIWPWRDRT